MNNVVLKDIIGNYTEYIEVTPDLRIYYIVDGMSDKSGFTFIGIEKNGTWADSNGDYPEGWDLDHAIVETFFHGIAYFDGIRHLYMGNESTNNYGYHYYPELTNYPLFFNKLKELEDKYCRKDEV